VIWICDARKAPYCDIPFWSITGLSHDTQVRNMAAAYGSSGGSCYGQGCVGEVLVMAILAPFHVRREYVTIRWRDNGVPRATYLRFLKADFPSFEREMAARTNLTFENVGKQRDKIRQQIESRKSEALSVRLDRGTFIRNEPVHGGLYQTLIIEREPGAGDLYLYCGKQINSKKPAWVIPVSIIATAENMRIPDPEYNKRVRWKNLEAIRMPGRTVRVMP